MRLSFVLILGSVAIGSAVSAEPPKNAAAKPAKPVQAQPRPAAIVLASADVVRGPAADGAQASASPAKRRVAPRVTSCRCGDTQAQPDPQDQ